MWKSENPFYAPGSTLLGHEFHYSSVKAWKGREENLAFSMQRGSGFIDGKDGVCINNVLATYTHIHALGTPSLGDGAGVARAPQSLSATTS